MYAVPLAGGSIFTHFHIIWLVQAGSLQHTVMDNLQWKDTDPLLPFCFGDPAILTRSAQSLAVLCNCSCVTVRGSTTQTGKYMLNCNLNAWSFKNGVCQSECMFVIRFEKKLWCCLLFEFDIELSTWSSIACIHFHFIWLSRALKSSWEFAVAWVHYFQSTGAGVWYRIHELFNTTHDGWDYWTLDWRGYALLSCQLDYLWVCLPREELLVLTGFARPLMYLVMSITMQFTNDFCGLSGAACELWVCKAPVGAARKPPTHSSGPPSDAKCSEHIFGGDGRIRTLHSVEALSGRWLAGFSSASLADRDLAWKWETTWRNLPIAGEHCWQLLCLLQELGCPLGACGCARGWDVQGSSSIRAWRVEAWELSTYSEMRTDFGWGWWCLGDMGCVGLGWRPVSGCILILSI